MWLYGWTLFSLNVKPNLKNKYFILTAKCHHKSVQDVPALILPLFDFNMNDHLIKTNIYTPMYFATFAFPPKPDIWTGSYNNGCRAVFLSYPHQLYVMARVDLSERQMRTVYLSWNNLPADFPVLHATCRTKIPYHRSFYGQKSRKNFFYTRGRHAGWWTMDVLQGQGKKREHV
jgi:hypothetical protein